MSLTIHKLLALLFIVAGIVSPINCLDSRKLDESSTVPGAPNSEIKCSSCSPCNPCNQSPPPPPPPSPPPPPKKQPPPTTQNCPPPPSPPSSFIYITGPPGDLYPVDTSSNADYLVVGLPVMICLGLLGLMAF